MNIIMNNNVDKDKMANSLLEIRNLFTKSLAPKNFLKKGTTLTSEMITLKKPGTGINSSDLKKLIGKKLKKDVNPNRLFKNEDFYE